VYVVVVHVQVHHQYSSVADHNNNHLITSVEIIDRCASIPLVARCLSGWSGLEAGRSAVQTVRASVRVPSFSQDLLPKTVELTRETI
jgi:hypothetical protein